MSAGLGQGLAAKSASTVWLLDDDLSVLKATGRLLASAGWEVERFIDPDAFLRHANTRHPALLHGLASASPRRSPDFCRDSPGCAEPSLVVLRVGRKLGRSRRYIKHAMRSGAELSADGAACAPRLAF